MTFKFVRKRMLGYFFACVLPSYFGVSGHKPTWTLAIVVVALHSLFFSCFLALAWFGRDKGTEG